MLKQIFFPKRFSNQKKFFIRVLQHICSLKKFTAVRQNILSPIFFSTHKNVIFSKGSYHFQSFSFFLTIMGYMISGKHLIIGQDFFWILGKMRKDCLWFSPYVIFLNCLCFFNQGLKVSFWFSNTVAHHSILI